MNAVRRAHKPRVFRQPNGWPRSIRINGSEMPLTDRETDDWVRQLRISATRIEDSIPPGAAASRVIEAQAEIDTLLRILHFVRTGELRDDDLERRAWRASLTHGKRGPAPLALRIRARRALDTSTAVDAADSSRWPAPPATADK